MLYNFSRSSGCGTTSSKTWRVGEEAARNYGTCILCPETYKTKTFAAASEPIIAALRQVIFSYLFINLWNKHHDLTINWTHKYASAIS